MPLPKNFDWTIFEEIYARDIDLVANFVTFSVEGTDLFTSETKRMGDDSKTFYASLSTTVQILRLDGPLKFQLRATDAGTPQKNTLVDVTIIGQSDITYVEPPVFDKSLYLGSINENLDYALEPISFTTISFSEEIVFDILPGCKGYNSKISTVFETQYTLIFCHLLLQSMLIYLKLKIHPELISF